MKAKGDYQDRVYSDQMVLRMSGGEAGQHEQWSKATQGGGQQARVHSDQMVLVMARRKVGPCEQWPKDTQSKAKSQGEPPVLGPLMSDGSRGSQAGRMDCVNDGQRCS